MLKNIRKSNYYTRFDGFDFSTSHDSVVIKEAGFDTVFDVEQKKPLFSVNTFEDFLAEVSANHGGMASFLSPTSKIRLVCDDVNYKKASYYYVAQLEHSFSLSEAHIATLLELKNGNSVFNYEQNIGLNLNDYKDYRDSLTITQSDEVYSSIIDVPIEEALFLYAYNYITEANMIAKVEDMESHIIESASAELSKAILVIYADLSLVQDLTGNPYSGDLFADLATNPITNYYFVEKNFVNTDGSFEVAHKTGIVNMVTTINAKSKESPTSEVFLNPELENLLDAFNGTLDLASFLNPPGVMDFMEYSFWDHRVNFIQILHSIRKINGI